MASLDGLIQHPNGQRHLATPAFGVALEVRVVACWLEVAIGIIVRQLQAETFFKGFHQMLGIRAVATQVDIDRRFQADGLVVRQADFFMQQLHQLAQGVGVRQIGGEFHNGGPAHWT